jgi:DNA-binding PucR family transcriptional regulator
MLTAKAFIDAGLNATRAAVKLYVHRNTFNYRLDKFIEQTGLDIRDYHHAFYFKLAQQAIIG